MASPPPQRSPHLEWPLDGWKIGVAVILFAGLAVWWWVGLDTPDREEAAGLPLATSQAFSFGSNSPSEQGQAQTSTLADPSLALTVVALVSAVAATPPPTAILATPTLEAAALITPTATATATPAPALTLSPLPPPTATLTATPPPIAFDVIGGVDAPLANSRPALYGVATPGAILLIDVNENRYFVEADASGEWIFVSPAPLPAGTTTMRVGFLGPGGRGQRDAQSLVVQIAEDAQPIPPPTLDPLPETLDALPTLSGRASVGNTVQIYVRRHPNSEPLLLAETVAADDGRWSAAPEPTLSPGDYALWVVLVDGDGQPLSRSATQTATIAELQP